MDVVHLSDMLGIDLHAQDPEAYLSQLGLDSLKLVEATALIEEAHDLVLAQDDLFSIQVKHLSMSRDAFQHAIHGISPQESLTNHDGNIMPGYCTHYLKQGVISRRDFLAMQTFKQDILQGPDQQVRAELLSFIEMSRVVVGKLEENPPWAPQCDAAFFALRDDFFARSSNHEFFPVWARFNATIIRLCDPSLQVIPSTLDDVALVHKYLG